MGRSAKEIIVETTRGVKGLSAALPDVLSAPASGLCFSQTYADLSPFIQPCRETRTGIHPGTFARHP
jgi:hypothetical protein